MTLKSTLETIRKSIVLHKVPKAVIGDDRRVIITSLGTERITTQAEVRYEEWRRFNGLSVDGPHLISEITEFLEDFAETHSQSSVDQTRQALARQLALTLPKIQSLIDIVAEGRAYTWPEVKAVARRQRTRNAFSTLLAFDAGLRAAELITIGEESEAQPSGHRRWRSDMFKGRTNIRFMVVAGKGGLRRRVAVDERLYQELQKFRRPRPERILDRGIWYQSYFHIGGGQSFSQSFSDASMRALRMSKGGHGLRHGFAQRRVQELMALGNTFLQAVEIVSVELGHFRPLYTYYQART
jgi:integrase